MFMFLVRANSLETKISTATGSFGKGGQLYMYVVTILITQLNKKMINLLVSCIYVSDNRMIEYDNRISTHIIARNQQKEKSVGT